MSTMNSSESVAEQRLRALAIANQRRFAIAAVRRHLREAGTRQEAWSRLADMLDEGLVAELDGLTVAQLLSSCARTGPRGVRSVLLLVGCTDRKRANDLRATERDRLTRVLRAGDIRAARSALIEGDAR